MKHFFNALPERAHFLYNKKDGDFKVKIASRGNSLLSVKLFEPISGETKTLNEGKEYIHGEDEIIFKADFMKTLPEGVYSIFTARYSRGSAVNIPVYISAGELPKSAVLFDPTDYKGDRLKEISLPRVTRAAIEEVTDENLPFENCLSLSYDLRRFVGLRKPAARLKKTPLWHLPAFKWVSVWLCGDGSGNIIRFYINSRDNTPSHSKNEYVINWHGWKRLCFNINDEFSQPFMFHQLFEFDYTLEGAQQGTIKVGKIESLYDESLCPSDMGRPVNKYEPPAEPFMLDYKKGEKEGETQFFLKYLNDKHRKERAFLVLDSCRDNEGRKIEIPFEPLAFDKNGVLKTDFFAAFPSDYAFWLRAETESGRSTTLFPFNNSVDTPLYSELPPLPVRTVTKDNSRSAAFCWLSDDEKAESFMEIVRPDGRAERINAEKNYTREWAESKTIAGQSFKFFKNICSNKATAENLLPDTEYKARFYSGDKVSEHTFKTLPEPENTEKFSLVFLADSQLSKKEDLPFLRKTFDEALNNSDKPRLIVSLGDMVDNAGSAREFQYILTHLSPFAAEEIWLPTPGNHDQDDLKDLDFFLSRYNLPDRADGAKDGLCFHLTMGDYALISALGSGGGVDLSYKERLERELTAARDKKWKIVFIHASPYGKSGERFTKAHYAELFDKYEVDAVFSGHDHIYIRSSVRNGQRAEIGKGTLYCVMGTCGVSFDRAAYLPWHDYVYGDFDDEVKDSEGNTDQTYGVAWCESDKLTIKVFTRTGKVVDEIVLTK